MKTVYTWWCSLKIVRVSHVLVACVFLFCLLEGSASQAQDTGPKKIRPAKKHDTSPALSEIVKNFKPFPKAGESRVLKRMASPFFDISNQKEGQIDPALQDWFGRTQRTVEITNFEGISDQDNSSIYGTAFAPPDPDIDVGPNHVVQMVNILFSVYDKTGNPLLGPVPINELWTGFGGPCENDNDGDPIVLYDHLADRWLLSQFAVSTGGSECVAISATPDPTGAYYRYEFDIGGFPDYPKIGLWPNAYFATFRQFVPSFDMLAGAFEREKMLVGENAQMVIFSISNLLSPSNIDGAIAADLDGALPPPGAPGIFMGFQDDGVNGVAQDRLVMFEMNVDWNNPGSSTFLGPQIFPTDPFDMNICGLVSPANRDCVPQPGTTDGLDPIESAFMNRLAYRNFGTHSALVGTHTVDVGDFQGHAGVRWYELRDSGSGWGIRQQGTYSPDLDHRFMGSIAIDALGNIGLGYSVSSEVTFPSIRYTGQTAGAPLGVMNITEETIFDGSGSQLGSGNRWGDYTSMNVDPSDHSTFWYTNEYYSTTSSFNWRTRVAAFRFDEAADPKAPSALTAFSNYTTPTSVTLSWVDPDSLVGGGVLDSFVVRIYRDNLAVLIADVPPGTQSFVDTGLVDGDLHYYHVQTLVTGDSSVSIFSDGASAYVGGAPKPFPPTDFVVKKSGPDTLVIFWSNPARNIDGTEMDDFSGVDIYEDDVLVTTFSRTTGDTGKADSGLYPSPDGTHEYFARAFDNEIPSNESDPSNRSLSPMAVPFYDQFLDIAGPDAASWINTTVTVSDRGVNPPSPDLSLTFDANPNGPEEILSFPMDLRGYDDSVMVLAYWYQPEGSGNRPEADDSLIIEFSNSKGNWIKVREFPGEPEFPFQQDVVFVDSINAGPGATFFDFSFRVRFRGTSTPASTALYRDVWFVDDVYFGPFPGIPVGIESPVVESIPGRMELYENYPNPFNPVTTIKYDLSRQTKVSVRIFNVLGQEVRTLENGIRPAGRHSVNWDGKNDAGLSVSSGVYLFRLDAGSFTKSRKMLLIR